MAAFDKKEREARTIGASRTLLLKRLKEAKSVLYPHYKKLFTSESHFDFANKRLVSSCGQYALQWRLRPEPSEPQSYENQQTSRGSVSLERLSP